MPRTKAIVPDLAEAKNIKVWNRDNLVISVDARECSEGYSLNFWVSTNKALTYRLALIGGFTASVNARSLEDALEAGSKMFDKILDLVSMGRQETIHLSMDEETKPIVGLAHIYAHRQVQKCDTKKGQTLMEIDFLIKELGYKTAPLRLLAKMENITISEMRSRVIVARGY